MKEIIWRKNKLTTDLVWSKQLSVGNAILDSEHRNLITKINNIMHMIKAGNFAALPDKFGMLEAWLIAHFENERLFARSINFDFEQHELTHQRILNELLRLRDELVARNWAFSKSQKESCYQLLHGWIVNHIAEDDMQLKPVLQNCPYGYIPSTIAPVIPPFLSS